MMIVPKSWGVLNLKCIFKRETRTQKRAVTIAQIHCTTLQEQHRLSRPSAECLLKCVQCISMRGAFAPRNLASSPHDLTLGSSKEVFQIQYSKIHPLLNYGIKNSPTSSISCWFTCPGTNTCIMTEISQYRQRLSCKGDGKQKFKDLWVMPTVVITITL